MTNWLAEVGDLPTALVMAALGAVMLLDAIPLIGVLVPGDVAVLGAMATRGPAGGAGVLFVVVAGCLAGWSGSFLVGRYFGARIRRGRVGAWIGETRWDAAEQAVSRSGVRMVMMAPFLPVLNALVPLAAGGLRMSYRRFLGSAAVGGALWAGCYVGLGMLADALGGLLPGGSFTTVASILIGLTFGWIVLLSTRRQLAKKSAPNESAGEGVISATAGMPVLLRPAGRVCEAPIPGLDRCHAPRSRRGPRRRPSRAGVDGSAGRCVDGSAGRGVDGGPGATVDVGARRGAGRCTDGGTRTGGCDRWSRVRTRRRWRRDAAAEGSPGRSRHRLVRPGR